MSTASPSKQGWPSLVRARAHPGLAGLARAASVAPCWHCWHFTAGSSPAWKPSFAEIFLRAACQEGQFCGHTVTPAYGSTKDTMGIIHQVRALAFFLGLIAFSKSWNITFMCSSFLSLPNLKTFVFCILWFLFPTCSQYLGFYMVIPFIRSK